MNLTIGQHGYCFAVTFLNALFAEDFVILRIARLRNRISALLGVSLRKFPDGNELYLIEGMGPGLAKV